MKSVKTFWDGRLCDFLDHITWHNLRMTQAYNHNSDQNICWTWSYKKIVESATQDLNVLNWRPKCTTEWSRPAHYVGCVIKLAQACPNGLAWCLVEHSGQGLDPWTLYILTRVKLVNFFIICKRKWKRNILSQILFLKIFSSEKGIKQIHQKLPQLPLTWKGA